MKYKYKMVPIPQVIPAANMKDLATVAASFLEELVNGLAPEWEFYRVDAIGSSFMPGCLGLLTGNKEKILVHYVVTFRKQV